MRKFVSLAASLAVAAIGLGIQVSPAGAVVRGTCTVTAAGEVLNLWCEGTDGKLTFTKEKPYPLKKANNPTAYAYWLPRIGIVTHCDLGVASSRNLYPFTNCDQ